MTDQEVLALLLRIDNGYMPTDSEKEELSTIENVTWSRIERIPGSIGNLTSLQSLDLSDTQLSALPDSIGNLTSLQSLSLSFTQISSLPESIGNLPSLQRLYLSDTQISSLPDSIGNLTNLQSLDLSYTWIKALPESIGKLTSLQRLDLSSTQIRSLPDSIGDLPSLQSLDLRSTQMSSLPESIGNLTSLQSLDLRSTQMSSLPESIGNLTSLQSLDLSSTQLSEIPDSIGNLTKLSYLFLENLTLAELPESLLNLNLEYISRDYAVFEESPGIYIYGLKLQNQPIEIFSQDIELIRAYYREHDRVPVNECKVVFLGDPEAGKTHAIKRLMKKGEKLKEFENQSTPGIEINVDTMQMEGSSIIVNYWDFGGQEIQHSMHRMFLTERTIYVVFLNARQDPLDDRARYWLENICSFAKDAPVLLVINKMDQNERPKFNEDGIRNDYGSHIKKIVRISALEDEPKVFMDELQGSINDIIRELPTVSSKVPQSWKNLMEDIRTMPDHYLTTKQFKERCSACSVGDYDTIHDELVDLFQVIGISFCYYTNRALADYMLLNPKWLVNAIYTIISNSKEAAHNGVITQDDLYDLLKEDTLHGVPIRRVIPELRYESYQVNYILGVIRMFRLSYPMKDGSEFFPMLCDGNEKITVDKVMSENALHYIFRYTYLPANVMHRLVVEMQRDLKEEYVWYSGAVFRNDYQKQTAYIHTKGNDLHIYVDALDPYYNPNEYLTPIQSIVRAINRDMNLSAEEYVTYREGDTEAEIDAEELKGNLESGIDRVYNKKLKRAINYRDVTRRYNDMHPKIKGDLLLNIIKALGLMQNESACYKTSTNSHQLEDLRNRYVSSKVLMAGYNCNDQQSGGLGEGGRQAGERDIVFRNKNGQDILIYEGLNLTSFNKKNIDIHLHKLMENYNPQGLPYGVLVSYVDCNRTKFNEITVTYRNHITNVAPENYVCIGQPRNIPTIGQYLKCIEMDYKCVGQYFTIYHILVGMVEQM